MLGRRFLELVLSPDAIALHRIIVGEVTRFPMLGEVFWRAGPERERAPDRGFLAQCGGRRRIDDARPRGSPPSNSSASCAPMSNCASCSASKPKPSDREIEIVVEARGRHIYPRLSTHRLANSGPGTGPRLSGTVAAFSFQSFDHGVTGRATGTPSTRISSTCSLKKQR